MTATQTPPRESRAVRERAGSRPGGPRAGRRPARWKGPAWLDGPMTSCHLVLGSAGLLLLIGLVMVFSASAIEAALDDEPAWAPGVKQMVLACIGLGAMVVAMRLPVGLIRRWAPVALLVVFGLLLIVLIPGIGQERNGARQWIPLGVTDFQPSELGKLVFALWGAHVLALRERYLTTQSLLVPVLPVFGVLSLLLILEPDFGGVVSLGLVLVGLLWAGGMPMRWFAAFAGVGAVLTALMVWVAPYRMARITAFLDPFADPTNTGFQAIRGMYALATGGLWGVGLGNSKMKWKILPEAESDYIFAIIGEELGFLGCLVVVTLYGVLAYAGFRIARRSADRFVQLACVAITVWLIGQATMNMGYVVGMLPVTGVTLPLISAGGTSLILTLFIVGLLARFACSEPAAVEHLRTAERGWLARLLMPAPTTAVDPVRPFRFDDAAQPVLPVVGAVRTLLHARGAEPRRTPPRAGAPRGPRTGGTARAGSTAWTPGAPRTARAPGTDRAPRTDRSPRVDPVPRSERLPRPDGPPRARTGAPLRREPGPRRGAPGGNR